MYSPHPRNLCTWWEFIQFEIKKSILVKGEGQMKNGGSGPLFSEFFPLMAKVMPAWGFGLLLKKDLKKAWCACVSSASCEDAFEFYVVVFSVKQLSDNNRVAVKMNLPWVIMFFLLVPSRFSSQVWFLWFWLLTGFHSNLAFQVNSCMRPREPVTSFLSFSSWKVLD